MAEITEDNAPDPSMLTKMYMLRDERDRKLRETDHWAFQDTPDMTEDQKTYRQALRDITKTYDNIATVIWPTKPS